MSGADTCLRVNGDRTTPHMGIRAATPYWNRTVSIRPLPVQEFEQIREDCRLVWARFDGARTELDAKLIYVLRYAADLIGEHEPIAGVTQLADRAQEEDLAARLTPHHHRIDPRCPRAALRTSLQGCNIAWRKAPPPGNATSDLHESERWRWVPRDLGDRAVLINIPRYPPGDGWRARRSPCASSSARRTHRR
jgi:hypothetical protein